MLIGIHIGGTTTHLIGYDKNQMVHPITVRADDPVASAAGALGKFVTISDRDLSSLDCIALAGMGATAIGEKLLGLPVRQVSEFEATGRGGAFLSEISRAIVVSMGTGTALVEVDGERISHWGGTGIGGGTLVGLSKYILGITDILLLNRMAQKGRLNRVDLTIGDISTSKIIGLPDTVTASNFGKCSDDATEADIAIAIIYLVYQTIGIISIGAARATGNDTIILTGRLATLPMAKHIFDDLSTFSGMKLITPNMAEYATAVGASLSI